MTLRRFSSKKKFFGDTVRIYSRSDSNVTSGAAIAVIHTAELAIVKVARLIATFHISDRNCRVESKMGLSTRCAAPQSRETARYLSLSRASGSRMRPRPFCAR